MFEAEVKGNGRFLLGIMETIKDIVDEVTIEVDEEGMRLRQLDRSHIQFVELDMPSMFFDMFKCDAPMNFSIDTEDLVKALKRRRTGDTIGFKDYGAGAILVSLSGKSAKNFMIHKIDIEYEAPNPPELDFYTHAVVPYPALKEALYDMTFFHDKVMIGLHKGGKIICSAYNMEATIDGEVEITQGINAKSIYSLDPIRKGLKNLKDVKEVHLNVMNDAPIQISVEQDGCKFATLVAPRIESDDEGNTIPQVRATLFEKRTPYAKEKIDAANHVFKTAIMTESISADKHMAPKNFKTAQMCASI